MPHPAEARGYSQNPTPSAPRHTRRRTIGNTFASIIFSLSFSAAYAQSAPPAPATPAQDSPFTYADVADLATRADITAVVRPRSFAKVDPKVSQTGAETQRFYVDAQVDSLIRGDGGLPPRIAFLLDLPATEKPARTLKNKSIILFGRAGTRPGDFQLLSSQAMLPFSPGTDARVRGITTELLAQDAPPEIARVAEAFHVEGTVAGESETQIFLTTKGGRPISLSIVRRPDMQPRFGAALGEIVDEAADLPKPNTLLWYRLACGLPSTLPQNATTKLDAQSAPAAAADYHAFMERMAPCERSRPPVLGKPGIGG